MIDEITCALSLLRMVRAGCLDLRLSLKYDSRNLEARSRTHLLTFSLACAIDAGLEPTTVFWRTSGDASLRWWKGG